MRLVILGHYTLYIIPSKIVTWEMPESDINIDTQGVELGYDLTCALPGLIWMIQRIIFIIVPWLFYHIGFTSVQKHAQIMCSGLHGISSDNLHMKRRVFLWAQINHLTKCRAHDTLGDSAWLPSGYKWLRKWVSQYSKCVRVSESACTSLTSLTHRPLPFPFAPSFTSRTRLHFTLHF